MKSAPTTTNLFAVSSTMKVLPTWMMRERGGGEGVVEKNKGVEKGGEGRGHGRGKREREVA